MFRALRDHQEEGHLAGEVSTGPSEKVKLGMQCEPWTGGKQAIDKSKEQRSGQMPRSWGGVDMSDQKEARVAARG